MVGGPFAALSGGMSDVRSWNMIIVVAVGISEKITKVSERLKFGLLKNTNDPTGCSYFFGRTNTRAEIAEFFSVPPSISGPSGVKRTPLESDRTSNVSSAIISHRLPCNS